MVAADVDAPTVLVKVQGVNGTLAEPDEEVSLEDIDPILAVFAICLRLVLSTPALFCQEVGDGEDPDAVLTFGIHYEDWHRALYMLKSSPRQARPQPEAHQETRETATLPFLGYAAAERRPEHISEFGKEQANALAALEMTRELAYLYPGLNARPRWPPATSSNRR
ncbi:hypothetical protein HRG_004047 [Hirsutella rhossiliensis]|uniref:Uncharacterized protein n=1 Tax=Hirsutella rhossiliensis TaxID=111463 RepID=A0A9P8SKM4_9HYPO|nr:uncharacterized protein HRG_04047 [Hirsutella rhossiliensis]KAH0966031.1 hypothetical protein HRG_04047 [Hirsutella rhossiliensis]